jgi:hypothetical protein
VYAQGSLIKPELVARADLGDDVQYEISFPNLKTPDSNECYYIALRDIDGDTYFETPINPLDEYSRVTKIIVWKKSSFPLSFFLLLGDDKVCSLIKDQYLSVSGKSMQVIDRLDICAKKISSVITIRDNASDKYQILSNEQRC